MQNSVTNMTVLSGLVAATAMGVVISLAPAQNHSNPAAEPKSQARPNDDSGLQLSPGFCATVFADDIGHARHMVAGPNGVLYVNTWSGRYYGSACGWFSRRPARQERRRKGRCDCAPLTRFTR